jgi:hypothetical protein
MTTKTTKTVRAVTILPGQPACLVENFDASLEGLQAFVGGWIEIVHLGGRTVAVINEEGLLDGLPWNVELNPGQPLAGPVVLLREDDEGEFTSMSAALACVCALEIANHRLAPTPSSLDSYEEKTGQPAISVTAL